MVLFLLNQFSKAVHHCLLVYLQGPVENLTDHLSDPAAINGFNYATKFNPGN